MNLTMAYYQPPAATPEPGVHTSGRLGDQAAAGVLRSPDGADVIAPGDPRPTVSYAGDVFPYHNVVGQVTRTLRAPSAPVTTKHAPLFPDRRLSGAHGELAIVVAMPSERQTPWAVAQRRSFRAPPAPHDADVFANFVPATAPGDA